VVNHAAHETASTKRGMPHRLRILLAVLCGVSVANIYYAQPLLGQIGADLSLPAAGLGLVVALAQLGYLAGLIVLVPLSDLVDRRKLIALQIGAAATGMMLVAFSTTGLQLLIGITVTGAFSVVVQVIVAYAAAISHPEERGANIGVITSGVVVGIILARTVAGLVADLAGWRAVYSGSAVISLLIAAIALTMLPKDVRVCSGQGGATHLRPKTGNYMRAVGAVVTLTTTNRVFRTRALITLFLFASFGALWSGMALPLSEEPWRLSTTQIGLFGIAGLVGALGAISAGRWADEGKAQRVTGLSLIVLVLSWVLSAQATHSLVLLAVGVIALDFAVQAVHVTSQNLIVAHAPESSGRIIGSYMVFYSLGSAIGAISTTAVFHAAGWSGASAVGGGYAAAALIVWIVDLTRTSRARNQPGRKDGPAAEFSHTNWDSE